jgi:hypothetical protein
MSHPAYPSTSDLARECRARDRDAGDLETLARLRLIVADALAKADRIEEIRHPEVCWHVNELLETLHGELTNIDATAELIRTHALVLEDA